MSEDVSSELRTYHVSGSAFFKTFVGNREIHRETMPPLIERYGIHGKSVLALGPGTCEQEYWFYANGNSLFLVDIDEHGGMEPRLRTMPKAETFEPDVLTYVIGDARHVSGWLDTKFDTIFVSGLTPDELHRSALQQAFREKIVADKDLIALGLWPPDGKPLSPLVEEVAANGLAENGLLIVMSYRGGAHVIRAKNYVPALIAQLERSGLALVEVHCLASVCGVQLIVAQKSADARRTKAWQSALAARPPLVAMHARTTFAHTPIRVVPGPAKLAEEDDETARRRIGPEVAEKLRASVGAAIDRFAPSAKLSYYAGPYVETEGLYLLKRKIDAEFGWGAALRPPAKAFEQGLVHPSHTALSAAPPEGRYDLCFLTSLSEDENFRSAQPGQKPDARGIFEASTLPTIHRALRHGGMLLYQGRTGGINLAYDKTFAERLQKELAAAGFELAEAYYLKAAPAIFFFAASSAPGGWKERPAPDEFRFFSGAAVDNLAVRFWPRPAETQPGNGAGRG